ncbi:TPA: hypothetical protein ACKR4O_004940 [Pseudomonas aeruginosa]|uniref:hypothetical protein n=1 Tax=Pseudomonas aeruginosa TaxID=287 RepID=UPI001A2D5C9E|nr:hypothetical protein [Pseudomonas aeruginosa]
MNKANECTCPSGDGSLRWPCPAHPAVEQAGTNVGHGHVFPRADGVKMRCGGPALCSECAADAYRARAALAQPSPPPHPAPELDFSRPLETENGDPVKWICADVIEYKSARVCVAKDTGLVYSSPYIGLKIRNVMPEQAEAEGSEIVATLFTPNEKVHNVIGFKAFAVAGDCDKDGGEFYDPEKLMTVAQHERIVRALRAVITQLRQHKNDYMDAGQETYRALQNEIREREAEIARLDGLVSGRTAERDAALAEVERLRESKGDPSGSFDRCMKMMYERDENAKRLDAALARVAELEKGTVYVEARQCDECQHVGINDSADGLAACHDCDWTGPEPDEDKCPDCQRENCMAAACPQCGARYVLVASEEIAAPVAQAQHSVPEGFRELLEMLVASDLRKIRYAGAWRREVHDRASSILALLAAAPGMEVPQAWLDVQAERRRQITAEGWTPEHDDLYCAAELPRAAAAYILNGANDEAPAIWPFSAKWWKPRDARSNYVRASALILAEIERLDRAAAAGKEVGHE